MTLFDITATGSFISHSLCHPLESLLSFGPTLNEATFGLLGTSFKPERDLPSLEGKVILVTGGNSGLGRETILQLAKHHPSRIYLAARTESKARSAISAIQSELTSPVDIRYIPLDLSSFKSIRAAADQFKAENDRLDLLILNAGTMCNPPTKTEEGFEIQLGTNHVGHFLLTDLLLPTMQRTVDQIRASGAKTAPDVRVVTLASVGHVMSPTTFPEMTSTTALFSVNTFVRYGASKAANIFFASELARRHPEILSVSVHPGAVNSGLFDHARAINSLVDHSLTAIMSFFFRSTASGALNTLFAAGAPRDQLVNGAYYCPVGVRCDGSEFVRDTGIARKLWEWTETQISERNEWGSKEKRDA